MVNLVKILTTIIFCFLTGCATSQPKPLTQKQIESICLKKKIEATKPTISPATPPPNEIADTMQTLVKELSTLEKGLPPLRTLLGIGKLVSLIRSRQANASMFRDLAELIEKPLKKNNDFAPPGRLEIVPRWPQLRPRWPKDHSKTAPRPPQDDLEALLFATSFSSSILVRFCSNLGSICLPPPVGRPKCLQNRFKKHSKITLPQDGLQDRSKTAQDRSKTAPDPPKAAPRPPQMRPKGLQDRSKSAQVRPKSFEIIERCRKKSRKQTLEPQVRNPRTKQAARRSTRRKIRRPRVRSSPYDPHEESSASQRKPQEFPNNPKRQPCCTHDELLPGTPRTRNIPARGRRCSPAGRSRSAAPSAARRVVNPT